MKRILTTFGITKMQYALITMFYLMVLGALALVNDGAAFFGVEKSLLFGEINYRDFSCWLLLMTTPVLVNGFLLSRAWRVRLFSCLRMRSWGNFYFFQLLICLCNIIIWGMIRETVLLLIVLPQEALSAGFLLFLSDCLWMLCTMIFYVMTHASSTFGLLVLIAFGGSFLIGEFISPICLWMPSTWSMLCRTKDFWEGGGTIAAYAAMSAVATAILFFLFCVMVRSKKYKEL